MNNIPERAKKELDKLLKGNQNFVNGTPTANNMCLNTLRKFAFHQEPYAVVLSCSDSRVVPEMILYRQISFCCFKRKGLI